MPSRNVALWLQYVCLNSSFAQLAGDLANHTLSWSGSGGLVECTNNQGGVGKHEELGNGVYQILLTAEEADCDSGILVGVSTTPGAAIVPVRQAFDTAPAADEIADAVLARSVSNVENTAPQASLTTLVLAAVNKANTEDNAGYLTVYRTDGATEHVRIPISVDPTAVPIDGVG
jgi:hypothetical protein